MNNKISKEKDRCKITSHRSSEDTDKLVKSLNRIEGQVQGIKRMVEEDRHCDDILIQISAVEAAIKSLGEELLIHHMKTCMIDDIKNNQLETIDEVMDLVRRLK